MHSPLLPHEYEAARRLLISAGFSGATAAEVAVLGGDGSDRRFARFVMPEGSVLAVFPSAAAHGKAEARSCVLIGRHLRDLQVKVPEIFAHDPESGLVLMQDLGATSLYEKVGQTSIAAAEVRSLYRRAVRELARFQIIGRTDFDPGCCWDTAAYDTGLMIARESDYFHREFCVGLLGMPEASAALTAEFAALADRAARQPAVFLLHRDFQSRNIMISGGDAWFIDFQGARLGPLGYDLASLLIDPYIGLPQKLQDELIDHYLDAAEEYLSLDRQGFLAGYYYLMLQRNLQMLGAFCFLSRRRNKPFFQRFIRPAAEALARRLTEPAGAFLPRLRGVVEEGLERLVALTNDGIDR